MKSKNVICINNNNNRYKLTIGKIYSIDQYCSNTIYSGNGNEHTFEEYAIYNDTNTRNYYDISLFLTLAKYRKQKLNKINENK